MTENAFEVPESGEPRFRGLNGLPQALRNQVEFLPSGRPRAPAKVVWFYRFLETGDDPQSARDAGYSKKTSANMGWNLRQEFAPLILKAMKYKGASDLPFARAILLRVMRAYDPEAKIPVTKHLRGGGVEIYETFDPARAGPAMATAAVKAAETYMDRFRLPKTERHEIIAEDDVTADFRLLIDRMVASVGLDSVRQMAIMERREYRDYLEGKYGKLEVLEGEVKNG